LDKEQIEDEEEEELEEEVDEVQFYHKLIYKCLVVS